MNWDKVTKVSKAIIAVVAVCVVLYPAITFLIAQEVQKYEAPTQQRLASIESLLLDDKAHKLFIFCIEYEYEGYSQDERIHYCTLDKEARIKRWRWERCMAGTGNALEICEAEPPDPDQEL